MFAVILQVRTEEDGSVVHNVNYSRLFDVKPLTSVNLDTYIKQTGLNLTQGKAYHVIVIATDEAGGCVDTSGVFTVDTTPPQDGHLGVGPENDMVSYEVNFVIVIIIARNCRQCLKFLRVT